MLAGGSEERVPRGLAVVMGVQVDETGRHEQSVGIDDLCAAAGIGVRRDVGDDPVDDAHVGNRARRAGAVDDEPVADHQLATHHVIVAARHCRSTALPSTVTADRRDGERLHRVVKAVARPVYRGCWRMRVEGRSNVPAEGGVIVAANHVSFFDSVVLLQEVRRRAYFLGKAEYLDSWTTKHLFPAMGLIPIDREQARKAMAALDVAAGVLHRGDVLGIYPEGTRSQDGLLHRGHTGVAQLALTTGRRSCRSAWSAPKSSSRSARVPRPFKRATVRFGAPSIRPPTAAHRDGDVNC